ncbi:MAG: hypothetical protein JNL28_13535 [Planctomycetes bacterium]|nr:hypothetical protein [Planctomycetota bacterium]
MIAALALVLAGALPDGLQTAVERVAAHDFPGAWAAANAETDAQKRAEARVYVRHHSGDLEGALLEAEAASAAYAGDAWLAERALYIALSLGRVHSAERALPRLESALNATGTPNRDSLVAALERARPEVAALVANAQAREALDRRAHTVVFGIGAAATLLLVWLARRA